MQLPFIGKVRQPTPWIIGLVAAGLVGTGTAVYVVRNNAAMPDISTLTVPVTSQDLAVQITANGTVQPAQTVNLSPKTSGILEQLYVEQGDRVTQGQIIARMESNDIAAEITQARARVAQAQARLDAQRAGSRPEEIARAQASVEQAQARVAEAQARVNLAEDRVARNRSLVNEGAIARDRFDEVLSDAEGARASLEQARAGLREAQRSFELSRNGNRVEDIAEAEARLQEAIGSLQSIMVRQEDTILSAPFSGIITQRFATEGAFVTPTTSASTASSATSTAIVSLASGLEVIAKVPEVDIQQLRVGQPVEIRADAYPNQVFQGRVQLVAPEAIVEQNVTSFQVRVEMVSGQDTLLSGMNVDLTFLGDQLSDALVVPTVAIVTKDGQTGVLVPDATNRAVFRPVVLGIAIGDRTQVLNGLQSGERIFTDLPPGQNWEDIEPEQS